MKREKGRERARVIFNIFVNLLQLILSKLGLSDPTETLYIEKNQRDRKI